MCSNKRNILKENNNFKHCLSYLQKACNIMEGIIKNEFLLNDYYNGSWGKYISDSFAFIGEFINKFGNNNQEPDEKYIDYIFQSLQRVLIVSYNYDKIEYSKIYNVATLAMTYLRKYEECKQYEQFNNMTENKKNMVSIKENEFKKIIAESIKKVLKEDFDYNYGSEEIKDLRQIYQLANQIYELCEKNDFAKYNSDGSLITDWSNKIMDECLVLKDIILKQTKEL